MLYGLMSRPAGAFLLNKFTIDLFLKVVGHSIINLTTIESYGGNGNENEKSYAGGNRYREIS